MGLSRPLSWINHLDVEFPLANKERFLMRKWQLLSSDEVSRTHRQIDLPTKDERKGSTLVLGLFLSVGLIGLTAISMDLGYIRVAQTELRRNADAVAMAGCWELLDQYRSSGADQYSHEMIYSVCNEIAQQNKVGPDYVSLGSNDLQIGRFQPDGTWSQGPEVTANAVRVVLRRDSTINGELPLFFGILTGRNTQQLSISATAAMYCSIGGFYLPNSEDSLNILPIALDLETWNAAIDGQTSDQYQFSNGIVQQGSDGAFEANLYPQGTGSPGNRGTVDIGSANNSTNDIARQVLHGVSRQDLLDLGQPLEFDENGVLELNGDTGISAGIKDELASIIGKVRIIPIYSAVSGNGNNAMFMIVRWEGVRILDVKLTGRKNHKRLIVQPQKVLARNAMIDQTQSQESSHLFTPVLLVE